MSVPQANLVLHGAGSALSCAPDGSLSADRYQGFFAGDTRLISTYRFAVSGYRWNLLGRSRIDSSSAIWTFQNPVIHTPSGTIESGTLLLVLRRQLKGQLSDEFEILSYNSEPVDLRFTFHFAADFSDIFEVRDQLIWSRLNVIRRWHQRGFDFCYRSQGFHREVEIRFGPESILPRFGNTFSIFDLRLSPREKWKMKVEITPVIGGKRVPSIAKVLSRPSAVSLQAPPLLMIRFERGRLPELFGGVSKEEGLPVPYERANIPQAWAAATPVMALQIILGLVPDAPRKRCFISPALPEWIPDLAVENIPLGNSMLNLRLRRKGEETAIVSMDCQGMDLIVGAPDAPLWGGFQDPVA